MEPKDNESIFVYDTWKDIVNSDGWKYFKDLLEDHRDYLQEQVLISVSRRKFDEASDFSARADECSKILSLVDSRLADLKKEMDNGRKRA